MATQSESHTRWYRSTNTDLETGRIATFLAVALGLAGLTGLVIHATGGLADSPQLVDGLPVTLAGVLMASVYMFSPAVANVVTRAVTGEGWGDLMLRPNLRGGWRGYLVAWPGTVALVAVGAALYFAVAPGAFQQPTRPLVPTLLAAATLGAAVNSLFAFGEEFGWRAYLLPKLRPLGDRRAVVLHGVVWGVWHWPVVALGYNYGLDYPLAPVPGLLAMVVATVGLGGVLAWVTLESGSVWPAAVGHGTLNAVGSTTVLFVAGMETGLLGPAPVGVAAALPWLAVTALLLARMDG